MNHRSHSESGRLPVALRQAALCLSLAVLTMPALAQDGLPSGAAAGGDSRTVPRLPNGRPDLHGVWTNATVTPFERPEQLGDKAFFTPEEAQAFMDQRRETGDRDIRTDDVRDVLNAYNDFWWDSGENVLPNLRTSIVTDPPNGRVPSLTAERLDELDALTAAVAERCKEPGCAVTNSGDVAPADEPQALDLMTRCISFGTVVPMLPTAYNNNYQIVQSDDSIAILTEMVHQVRRIPTDGREHLPSDVRQWYGDSVGHWEGDTLIVETANFKGEMYGRMRDADENLRVTERFTRVGPDILLYQFTVNDPTAWTQPWSGEIPLVRADGMLYEYACHEGNRGMQNILRAARQDMATER